MGSPCLFPRCMPFVAIVFTELREKGSKLDQPEKLLLCSKSY